MVLKRCAFLMRLHLRRYSQMKPSDALSPGVSLLCRLYCQRNPAVSVAANRTWCQTSLCDCALKQQPIRNESLARRIRVVSGCVLMASSSGLVNLSCMRAVSSLCHELARIIFSVLLMLTLVSASKSDNPDSFAVFDGKECVGHVMRTQKSPAGKTWFWTIFVTDAGAVDRGYATTREQAMADLETAWLGVPRSSEKSFAGDANSRRMQALGKAIH